MRPTSFGGHISARGAASSGLGLHRTAGRVGQLVRYTRPHKARALIAIGALLGVTADHHRRAADGQAGDRPRHHARRLRPGGAVGGRLPGGGGAGLGVRCGAELPHHLGRRAGADRPSQRPVRPRAVAGARVLRAHPRRRRHLPADQRHRGAEHAGHRRPHHARAELDHAGGLRGGAADPGLEAGAGDADRVPGHVDRHGHLPALLGDRLPADARAAGRRHRQPAGGHLGRAGGAGVPARGARTTAASSG